MTGKIQGEHALSTQATDLGWPTQVGAATSMQATGRAGGHVIPPRAQNNTNLRQLAFDSIAWRDADGLPLLRSAAHTPGSKCPSRLGLDIQQAIDQFCAFAQVDHPQAAAFIIVRIHRLYIKSHTVILDFEQASPGSICFKRTQIFGAAACLRALFTASSTI